ncbi:o-succinylbenzoate synthase [Rubrobacter radiotolerans]|uniref:o-succinylbenzoate synthase n=1 Tax=Rubrobacter radiotolerans TaxID=42256 RepID=A0A023X5K9_RUBRA|nr:o-succinylbenzoate synthase [Rubrobacter radiotolerans]AHY47593.1 o-succinylbenzoate synthase [Rubrobacter radiotolerans]MDX5894998.1 o-succinylbenzoate synthase [Rubrobacter radiotolerans]SMC07242.1 O-succinylbenzoate synthase [Rubrobacter radiotolerans DSM 5868]
MKVEVYRYALPLTAPLVLKGETLRQREGLLLRLTDGAEGWGEAAPLPGFSPETITQAEEQLVALDGAALADALLGVKPDPLAGLLPSVRFAVEVALAGVAAGRSGSSFTEALCGGSASATEVPVSALISTSAAETSREARRVRETGYRTVKLKLGGCPVERDAALVRKVVRELGTGVRLRLDPNRAWDFDEALRFAEFVRDLAFEYVEEPLRDAARLGELVRKSDLPVALDESLLDLEPEDLEDHRYAKAVVIKPTITGGVSRALRFARTARRLGMEAVISAAYESGLGTTALVALAGATGGGRVAAGLDTYSRLASDVLAPRPDLARPEMPVVLRAPAPDVELLRRVA